MGYMLHPDIALRSWQLVPYAYYRKGEPFAKGLKKQEFELLLQCDGKHKISESELLFRLQKKGLVSPCKEEGQALSEWQKFRQCDNRYFPRMNWMLTGKCNYNCLHCFNAADNAPLMEEWTLGEAVELLDEAGRCGIHAFTLTGGEPMMHRHFLDILEGIYQREMYVEELNTNGSFISQHMLDRMKEIGCMPLMKISFDGIGHHDWLRNRAGAEEDALRAIRLCRENGFRVKVQTNVHRNNAESILPTARLMNRLGVEEMRIIRTTEAPRWVQNAKGATLDLAEYFDCMLEFAESYRNEQCSMVVDIWQFMTLFPEGHTYRLRPVQYTEGEYRDSLPVCKGNRGMVAVGANGELYPCHQMSGYYEGHGWRLGNVKKESLQTILQGGDYLSEVCTTVKTLAGHNEKCAACKYFKYCCGGCRAVGLALSGDKLGADISKCLFFEQGYYQKINKAMGDWRNLSCIKEIYKEEKYHGKTE